MSSAKVYLITGANRGLGRGFLESLIQRPNTTIIAGVRDLTSASTLSLQSLPRGSNSQIITVVIDSSNPPSAALAIKTLNTKHSITEIDVLIANAGISQYYGPATKTPLSEVREHFEINTIGVLALFQATYPLLQKSENPIFVAISTGVASIGAMGQIPLEATAYGLSKVGLNYLVTKAHFENDWLTAFVINPGWVRTDMGTAGAKDAGMEEAPVSLEDSIKGMIGRIDNATREKTGGTFASFDDTQYPW